jgi:adenylosuccinate lyase
MEAVKNGGDRQDLHERIRVHSMEAGKQVKQHGLPNDLLKRIAADTIFNLTEQELTKICNIKHFIGRASQQTEEFIREYIDPLIKEGQEYGIADTVELHV